MPFTNLKDKTKIHYIAEDSGEKKALFIHGNLANTIWWEQTLVNLPHKIKQLNKELADITRELEPLYTAWDRMTAEMETVLQTTKSPP